ncbi:metal-dependent hydrolase [Tsukamurella strandjordii]|uniref:metal-dependent hydrolase n=1 Tax=Tsukamurella TaxID=2060 RepID=UPI001C7E0DC8|nr:metal-dependent hydrolase [Tsukamurella sp. TY48]GIZ96150.1 metal-dependent hydrolase [Tsukamurella sp. TY48]
MTQQQEIPAEVLELHARNVTFDWTDTPLEWIKGDPFASDFTTGLLHMVLPEGERWFCEVFTEALPYVKDEDLARVMRGFIGQEAMHAESHDGAVTAYLERRGVDTAPFLRQMEFAFRRILGPRTRSRSAKVRYNDMVQRLWLVAAIEHYTAILGVFALNADWERFDVDPTMADICRWHGAEEVEHRAVAHDVAHYFDPGYLHRCRAMLTVLAFMVVGIPRVGRYVTGARTGRRQSLIGFVLRYLRASHRGVLPPVRSLVWFTLLYFDPRFHPDSIGSTEQARAYLATSPAVRASAQ